MTTQLADRLAKRMLPTVRRGLVVGRADSVKLFVAEDDEESEIWGTEVSRETDPELLAIEASGIADDEQSTAGVTRFRLRLYREGEIVADLAFRTAVKSKSADVVGESLLPKSDTLERALSRQAMRQAETAFRMLAANVEKQNAMFAPMLETLAKANADLQRQLADSVKANIDAVRAEREHDIALIRANTEAEAIKQGIDLVKEVGPRVAAYLSGENILHPLVGIVAKLEPEQVKLLVASGTITEREGADLVKAAARAKASVEKSNGKALPANGKVS